MFASVAFMTVLLLKEFKLVLTGSTKLTETYSEPILSQLLLMYPALLHLKASSVFLLGLLTFSQGICLFLVY